MNDLSSIENLKQRILELEEENRKLRDFQNTENYKSIFELSPIGIFHYDKNGVITNCNKIFIELLGSSKELLIGFNMFERIDNAELLKEVDKSLKNGYGFYEGYYTSVTGNKTTFLRATFKGIKIKNNSYSEGIGIIEDFTKWKTYEKNLKESEEKFKAIFNGASDGILATDVNTDKFYFANPKMAELTGYSIDELLQMDISKIHPADSLESVKNKIKEQMQGNSLAQNIPVLRKDKTIVYCDVTSKFLQIGENTYFTGFFRDITIRRNYEIALKESEKKFRTFVDMSPDAINISRLKDGVSTYINNGFMKLTGFSEEDIINENKDTSELWKEESERRRFVKELRTTGKVENIEAKFVRKDGSDFDGIISANVISLKGEKHVIAVTKDITDRKKWENELIKKSAEYAGLNEEYSAQNELLKKLNKKLSHTITKLQYSEERFRSFMETASDMMNIVDKDLNITYVNKAFIENLEYSEQEVLGMNVSKLLTPESREKHYTKENHAKLIKDGRIEFEVTWVSKYGKKFIGILKIVAIYNDKGEFTGSRGIFHDITERIKTEQKLIEANENLRKAKKKAEESEKLKSAFLANMSHEIRTPMNGILGFTQLLQKRNLPEQKRNEYLRIIGDRGMELLNIINDIIDISKITAKQVEVNLNDVELNACLDEQYDFFITKKETIKIVKNYAYDTFYAKLDKTKLNQILTNLINNAIKFTHTGYVEIGYSVSKIKNKDYIKFHIKDTGIGIPKDKHKVIFNRFTQAESGHTKTYGGTGLGLAITKSLVELMKGKVWVESEEGKGSTFYFTLPLIKAGTIDDNTAFVLKPKYNWTSKNILIAEDDEYNFILLKEILESNRATVIRAKNGIEAIEKTKTYNPDIILMDIKMPKLDGISAAKQIKQLDNRIPIIVQTAYAITQEQETSIINSFDALVNKPINEDNLLSLINKHLTI